MIEFIETNERIKAYFTNPLTQQRMLIGSCELFVGEEAITGWKKRINAGYYGRISEILSLYAKFQIHEPPTC